MTIGAMCHLPPSRRGCLGPGLRGELELYGGSNVCEQPPSSHRLVICVHRQDGSQRTSDAMHGLPDVHGRDFRQAQG
ncbi:hypothetical protein ACWEPL_50225, partial [Nonomuraea sp. NPDC004186]